MLPKSTSSETFKVVYERKTKKWAVMREGGLLSKYSKKSSALDYAKNLASNRNQNSELKIYGRDGSFQKKIDYSEKDSKSGKSGSYIDRKRGEFF